MTFRGENIGTARVGQKLRTAILRSGATPHNGDAKVINCRGLGTCGTCAVEILPADGVEPREWTTMERARLNFPPHKPPGNARLRLACQVRLSGACESVEVVKRSKFWGQGDEVVEGEEEKGKGDTTPFGSLEFVLDADEWKEGGALDRHKKERK